MARAAEVFALKLSRLWRGKPRIVQERVDLVRERFVADRKGRDLRLPVEARLYIRVDLGAGESELRDFGAESVRTLHHLHELVVSHHADEHTCDPI